ncbi:hypothetical protein Hanom_Chr14g01252951 [Helianthus anomalus]
MMMINDQFKDLTKNNSDILGLRNMTPDTITRLTKGTDGRVKGMICKISRPAYVAPEDDKWRYEKSDLDNEDQRMRPSVEPQQKLVDETMLEPSEVIEQGAGLLKQSLESFLKRNEYVAAQKDQGSSVQAEGVKVTEPEGEVQDDSRW